jgi:hypothetical protein
MDDFAPESTVSRAWDLPLQVNLFVTAECHHRMGSQSLSFELLVSASKHDLIPWHTSTRPVLSIRA